MVVSRRNVVLVIFRVGVHRAFHGLTGCEVVVVLSNPYLETLSVTVARTLPRTRASMFPSCSELLEELTSWISGRDNLPDVVDEI